MDKPLDPGYLASRQRAKRERAEAVGRTSEAPKKCGRCKGRGEVLTNRYNNESTTCSLCHGTGVVSQPPIQEVEDAK